MSTQFFERQEVQRRHTLWLVAAFIACVLLVVVVINLIVLAGLGADALRVLRREPEVVFWISAVVMGTILIASWHRSSQLRAGGGVVAKALGGVLVTGNEGDFKKKQLVNIVEEMAIAARIRKPQIFVLPDEEAINAFAAGHSPDEAAVAVTQGALDAFDREQLQAVIGHEFSHILNGDMKINMRLTAWIFGLCVITDLARRFMNKRGGGRGAARIKLIAFGIFLAGSAGALAGRLLQAAVSRRREHLADASAVQFTRNPQALQGAFVVMAASGAGTRLEHPRAVDVSHMFIASSQAKLASRFNFSWFATHPPLEERVQALDARVSPLKFRALVSDQRRKIAARASTDAAANAAASTTPPSATPPSTDMPSTAMSPAAAPATAAGVASGTTGTVPLSAEALAGLPADFQTMALVDTAVAANPSVPPAAAAPALAAAPTLAETMPSGVRMVGGRSLPPDVLRNRLSHEQQGAISAYVAQVERSAIAVQATFVAAMLASEPAKWRTQLTRLAPLLGIELLKETQAQVARLAQLAPASRLPLLVDLLTLLEAVEPGDRKRLRAVARAFAPTVATGDMLRFSLTRMLEKRLGKALEETPPVPLPERSAAVCELYAALAQCRFGAGKQGQNAYRAGVMGMLMPTKWAPYPDALIAPAALDTALAAVSQIHPTGKKALSEGMARVIAVGGRMTVSQVDLLRGACLIVDCPVPVIPIDVVFEEADVAAPKAPAESMAQASAR